MVLIQVQYQGPLPAIFDAVPDAQRLAAGVLMAFWPLAAPQAALVGVAAGAGVGLGAGLGVEVDA